MTDGSTHLLIVDDNREIRDSLAKLLRTEGHRVTVAENASTARRIMKASSLDLILLDIMMPGEDGLSLCRHIVENTATPVILLTARVEDTDRIIGLEMGADDYVTKPFNPRELMARIKAVIRRAHSLPPRQRPPKQNQMQFDNWVLNLAERSLLSQDKISIPLSTGEFRLLMAFLDHPKMVLSRDQLLDITQGREANAFDRSIDNQVSRLRRKLEEDPKSPRLIKTVWGGGYSFSADVATL
jgi:two-component system OmpR family response regulator